MDIVFYKNNSDNLYVNKALTDERVVTGFNLIEGTSIIRPTVTNILNPVPYDYNYCYIPEFERYYYINDRGTHNFGLFYFELKCDVLMSDRENILNSSGIITRQEKLYNRYLTDSEYSVKNYNRLQMKEFPNNCFDAVDNPIPLITVIE